MKVRSGFVSNSSSSSFIVAANKENTKITITLETDLKEYGEVLTTEQAIKDYFMDEYGAFDDIDERGGDVFDDVYIKKQYNTCIKEITAGNIIIVGSFTDDSYDTLEGYLCKEGIPKNLVNIKIIQNEGGY